MTTKKQQNPQPSPNGPAGRDAKGRFLPGNKLGKGNPHARQVAKLRSTLLNAVKPEDIRAIVRALVKQAKEGDLTATHELLDRLLGKPIQADVLERIEEAERNIEVVFGFTGAARDEEDIKRYGHTAKQTIKN